MQSSVKFRAGLLFFMLWAPGAVLSALAGVSQSIQDQYKRDYENKAMFLRIPIYTEKQIVRITGQTYRAEPGSGSPLHKVGDQLRILQVVFSGNEIKFRLGAIASQGEAEIIFRFDADLEDDFPNRPTFDGALQSAFTEGLKYTDIEDAKIGFLKGEFDRSVDRMAGDASLSREFVLEKIAPLIPDYRETQRERDALEAKVQDISAQLARIQADKRKLETETQNQNTELSRLKSTNAALQGKIDSSALQITKLDTELGDAKKRIQSFEREIANIKSSLNMEAGANRDLTRNNAELADRILALQKDLKDQKETNMRLADEIGDKIKEIGKMQSTIKTLSLNTDSLGRQYVKLKDEKEKLDDFALTVDALRARIIEEKTEGERYLGKADIYLGEVLLGLLDWNIPSYLSHNASGSGEANFSAESIDYVQITPETRRLLRSFGEKLKIRLNLVALSPTMTVNTENGTEPQALGERERITRKWQIVNNGAQDVSFLISARLINGNSREISLFQKEHTIATSNPIRRIRSYLQPVPLVLGIVLGFLLFGIVGIFRRPKKRRIPPTGTPSGPAEPKHYVGEKKL